MIGSDALRLKILQSIQMIATHSLLHSQNSNRPVSILIFVCSIQNNIFLFYYIFQSSESQQPSEQDMSFQDNFSMQSTVWSKPIKNSSVKSSDFTEFQSIFKGAIPFLNDHEDEIIQNSFLASLNHILLSSGSFKETVKDTVFQKHCSNILDEILEQYIGKK